MAYDEQLANRIRQAFGTQTDITERKMFGGLAFLYRGRMCCGIVGRDLMVRIPDDEFDAVMRGRHVRPMDFTLSHIRFVNVRRRTLASVPVLNPAKQLAGGLRRR
jgi:hypothetical protein